MDALIGSDGMLASKLNLTCPVTAYTQAMGLRKSTNASGAAVDSMFPQGPKSIIHTMKIRSFCFVNTT